VKRTALPLVALLSGLLLPAWGPQPRLQAALIPLSSAGVQTPLPSDTLRLDDALDLALRNNPEVGLALNLEGRARTRTGPGEAGFLPRLSLSAGEGFTRSDTDQTFLGQDPRSLRGAESRQGGIGARVDWTVCEGLGRGPRMDRLEREAREVGLSAREAVQGILSQVTLAYFELARQQQQIRVLEETLETSEERLRIAELREEIGSGSEVEARQARVDRNADEAALLRQRIEQVAARAELNRLLGRAPGEPVEVESAIEVDRDLDLGAVRASALERNPEILQARERVAITGLERREISAQRLPSLDLQAGVDRRRQTSESGFVQESRGTDLFVGIAGSLTLFDGFDRRRRGEEARLRQDGAHLTLREAEERFEAEFAASFARFRDRLVILDLELENAEIARRNVGTALEQFRLGVISSLELREAQEALTRAETQRLESEFAVKAAETELRRLAGAVGEELPTPGAPPS
jgi:outer membrane protein